MAEEIIIHGVNPGTIGQKTGIFEPGDSIVFDNSPSVKLGFILKDEDAKKSNISYDLEKADSIAKIQINNNQISFGKTGIYELDDVLENPRIYFPMELNVTVDYAIIT